MAGFHIENFGCRAARADGEAVGDRLRDEGLVEESPVDALVVVVNTCSVTAEADRAARAFIRRTHRRNPAASIVVTGCYAQRAPDELAAIPGVRAVVGNSHKALAPGLIAKLANGRAQRIEAAQEPEIIPIHALLNAGKTAILADDRFAHSFLEEALVLPGNGAHSSSQQTRPNLKIQEGCENRCTFCVIPQTRGSSRSLAADSVLRQVEGFVAAGGKELVLSGINLGRWGRDFARTPHSIEAEINTLTSLVRTILNRTSLPRLRLSSIEPMDWTDELISLMGEHATRIARHAHLPLQSGSDAVLRRMRRRYRPWHYAAKIQALLNALGPALTLGADVMAGFPGETDAEFEETLALIRSLPYGYLHLFPFSPRPGTPAWALHRESPVPQAVVDQRMGALRSLAAEKKHAHRKYFVGETLEAITLATGAELAHRGMTNAISENFLPIELDGIFESNQMLQIQISSINADGTLSASRQTKNN